jgi:carboxymethylenebutenolidase
MTAPRLRPREDAAMSDPSTVSVACDGGEMSMHVWLPPTGSGPGLLLLQEIFGVGSYIRAVAARLAGAGYVVGAPDVFWRFAPGWAAGHDEAGLHASLAQVAHLDAAVAIGDCGAALTALADDDRVTGTPGVIGFCLGGTLAWGVALHGEPSVCVSYYGSGVPSMLDGIDAVSCPTLFHFGNGDAYIPADGIDAVNAAIAGRSGFVLNVENAGHAFDNHESAMFWNESAAQAAWAKTMAFLAEHLPPESQPSV